MCGADGRCGTCDECGADGMYGAGDRCGVGGFCELVKRAGLFVVFCVLMLRSLSMSYFVINCLCNDLSHTASNTSEISMCRRIHVYGPLY